VIISLLNYLQLHKLLHRIHHVL